ANGSMRSDVCINVAALQIDSRRHGQVLILPAEHATEPDSRWIVSSVAIVGEVASRRLRLLEVQNVCCIEVRAQISESRLAPQQSLEIKAIRLYCLRTAQPQVHDRPDLGALA